MMHGSSTLVAPAEPVSPTPPRAVSLRRNFAWTLAGNVVYAGSQWGVLVVLAKLGSPNAVGQFGLALAVTAPVMLLCGLQLRGVLATDARDDFSFGHYFSLTLMTTLVGMTLCAALAWSAGYESEVVAIIAAVAVGKGFTAVADIFYGLMQKNERMEPIAISMILTGLLSVALTAVAFFATGSVVAAASAWAISTGLVAAVYTLPLGLRMPRTSASRMSDRPLPSALAQLAWLALPLGFVMMLVSLNANIPRYFMERYWGERELGVFVALASLLLAGNTVIQALGQSASPRLAKYYAAGDLRAFKLLLGKLLGLGLAAGLVGILVAMVAGGPILRLLYTAEYAEHQTTLVWLMVAATAGFVASFLGFAMTALRRFRSQTVLFTVVALLTAISGLLLIEEWGLLGSAWTLLIASTCQAIGAAAIVAWSLQDVPTAEGRSGDVE